MKTPTDPHAVQGGIPSRGPALVAFVAPWCSHCVSLRPGLDTAAAASRETRLLVVDVAEDPEAAARLGIRGTPTLIGFRDGMELFRHVGNRGNDELTALFASLVTDSAPRARVGETDAVLRLAAGAGLVIGGVLAGPAWPLVAIGAGVVGYGVITWRRRDG